MIVLSSSLSHLFQLSLIYQLFYLLTQLLFILFIFSTNSLLFLISHILLYNPLILCFLRLLPPSLYPLLPSPPFPSYFSFALLRLFHLLLYSSYVSPDEFSPLRFSSHLSIDVFPSLLFCSLLSFDVFSSLLFCSLLSFDVFSSVLFSDAGCSGYRSLERHTRQAYRSD